MFDILYVFVVTFVVVTGLYEYRTPFNSNHFATNTHSWNVLDNGERSYYLSASKYFPKVCYMRFYLHRADNARYMDCRMEYLMIGSEKVCGKLKDYYQYPFGNGEWSMRYRGDAPLEIDLEQVSCGQYESNKCDIVSSDVELEITSPNYPDEYPSSSSCHYTIIPANEAICQVSIYFQDFDVEDSPDCQKDKLLIGNEPFCGRTKNYRFNRNLTNNLVMTFESDSSISGRGFRINIEQIHCGNTLNYQSKSLQRIRDCCKREFMDTFMILTSPGFLSSQWVEASCKYTVLQSSPSVCRLRFHFKHFWVGEEDIFYGCVNGFIEIDNRRFCGCLDGYEYVTYFDADGKKDMWYSYSGSDLRGFVIEVYQEECGGQYPFRNNTEFDPNTEVEVLTTNITSEKAISRFLIPRDTSRCYQWSQPGWTQQIRRFLMDAPVPAFCTEENTVTASQFYPFPEDVFPQEPVFLPPAPPPFIPPVFPSLPPSIPPFPLPNCFIFDNIQGSFTSPHYPSKYAPNLKVCYAIKARLGYCGVLIRFSDFDLEKSFKCWKDYLKVGGSRYCGRYLLGKSAKFNVVQGGFFFLDFVTDGCFSGHGFSGEYKQLPCPVQLAKTYDKLGVVSKK